MDNILKLKKNNSIFKNRDRGSLIKRYFSFK